MFFLGALILSITFATGINAFLTFTMSQALAGIALMMLVISVVLDLIIFRNILVLVMTIIMKSISCCKCSH